MGWQKFRASQLFTGQQLLGPGHVLVMDEAGIVEAIVPGAEAGPDIQMLEGLLCPGFVNAHCHIELSHLKGKLPEHTGLPTFLIAVTNQRTDAVELLQEAMERAATAMHQLGVVAVGDICNTTDSLLLKQKSSLRWYNFIECFGSVPAGAAVRFAAAQAVFEQFEAVFPRRNSLVPHAPYSVSSPLLAMIDGAARGKIGSLHNQEAAAENEWFEQKTGAMQQLYDAYQINMDFFVPTGKSSLQSVLPKLTQFNQMLLVHDVATRADDLAFISKSHQLPTPIFVLCPNANLYIQNLLPPVDMLQLFGYTIALGTDSLASNHQLSILAEIQTLLHHFPTLSTEMVLRWATLNGAVALGMSKTLGSFEKGKKPGVVLINDWGTPLATAELIVPA